MSHTLLDQLTKKNQEFIHIATKQLIQEGKSDQEIKEILEEILPTIVENQKKGITARTLYGSPTSWATNIVNPSLTVAEKEAENDSPFLMWLDSFLLILGLVGSINGLTTLFSSQAVEYGLTTLILISMSGGAVFYALYHFIYRFYDVNSGSRPPFVKSFIIISIATAIWIGILFLSLAMPKLLNPVLPGIAVLLIGAGSLALRFYLKKKLNIKSAMQSGPRPQ